MNSTNPSPEPQGKNFLDRCWDFSITHWRGIGLGVVAAFSALGIGLWFWQALLPFCAMALLLGLSNLPNRPDRVLFGVVVVLGISITLLIEGGRRVLTDHQLNDSQAFALAVLAVGWVAIAYCILSTLSRRENDD